jgi:hypothetical protein
MTARDNYCHRHHFHHHFSAASGATRRRLRDYADADARPLSPPYSNLLSSPPPGRSSPPLTMTTTMVAARVMIPDNDDGSGSGMWLTGMGVYGGTMFDAVRAGMNRAMRRRRGEGPPG